MGFFQFQDVPWLPIADAILKATLLLGVAALCSGLLRRGSAAVRHLIWMLALLSALALPVLSLAVPRWQVPLLTLTAVAAPPVDGMAASPAPPRVRERPAATAAAPAMSVPTAAPVAAGSASSVGQAAISWGTVLLVVWLAGLLSILGRLAVGVIAVHSLARRTEPAEDAPWIDLARRLTADIGVSSRVRFLRSARATMPIACGIFRPGIVMPADADTWSSERLRIVLLHELAHVKRRDCLTHVLAQITCALYWFNPLAWIAARHVRTERERACDDLVLAAGTRAPEYADQLLEIARAMRAGRFPAVLAGASLAMAYRSQLEGRLMAILDPKVPRSGVTRVRAAAATALCSVTLLTLASIQPWAYAQEGGEPAVRTGIVVPGGTPHATAPEPSGPAPAPTPSSKPAPATDTRRGARMHDQEVVQGVIQGTTQGAIQGVVQGITQGVTRSAAQRVWAAVPEIEWEFEPFGLQDEKPRSSEPARGKDPDPRTVEALRSALKDTDKDVRQTALHALVQLRDPSIYDVLIEALRDPAADVRQHAAFGLAQLRDRRAVAALTAALKDTAADVRQQAVFALGQLRDPAAVDALITAARDADADVRQQAVFALGQIRDRRAVEALISSLKDANADVRQQAAFALGQIRDRAAVEALVIALKDETADVRQQAAFALGQLRDARAIEGLTAALKDASADVRQQAAFALGQIAR